jgi:prevent-host-death family protein
MYKKQDKAMEAVSYTNLRQHLKEHLDKVCADRVPLLVTRRGGEPVVMLSQADYDELDATAYLLRNPANAERLRRSITQAEAREFVASEPAEPETLREDDWLPETLAHVPTEDAWASDPVTVAEIKNFEDGSNTGIRITTSALVPIADLAALSENLAALGHEVRASGPHPFPREDGAYEPRFWMESYGLSGGKYEPLVLSWRSHDHTIFLPDPGFLMTYGLAPRSLGDGTVSWDDPTGPVRDVVRASLSSVYSFPNSTAASVKISRSHLQDYLTLRKMALVQASVERRYSGTDSQIEKRLGGREMVDINDSNRRLRLFRTRGADRAILAEASWARIVARPADLPISDDPLETEGLIWHGFKGPVTHARAMALKPNDFVYVDDGVLGDYEGHEEFSVVPESGAVSFGTQWAVGYCSRIGRNLIRLELKKLYEGVPPSVTRNWHKFAVEPPVPSVLPTLREEPNVAKRTKALTYLIVELGENLAALAKAVGLLDLAPGNFVGPRRADVEYAGWWSFPDAEAVSRHIPPSTTVDAFLDRCLSLNKLIAEGFVERSLRRTLLGIGIPESVIKDWRSLKLLDCIIRLCQVAHDSGLKFDTAGPAIWERLSQDDTDPAQPIPRLFALYDMRILKAHRWEERGRLEACLGRFSIGPNETAGGCGLALDKIYDALIAELADVNRKLAVAVGR